MADRVNTSAVPGGRSAAAGTPLGSRPVLRALRDVRRRRLRSALTIFGVVIGVFALTVLGSMAEKINALVAGGSRYFATKVVVLDATGGFFNAQPLSLDVLPGIRAVPGVAGAYPQASLLYERDVSATFGTPETIVAMTHEERVVEPFELHVAAGRELTADDRGTVVFGSDLARRVKAKVGETVTIRDRPYEVVGILEPTLTAPDTNAYLNLPDGQLLLHESLPPALRAGVRPDQLASVVTVFPEPGQDLEELARRVQERVPGVRAFGPKAFGDQVGSATAIFNAILFGVGLIALVVGGLSIINTMIVAVTERTREIGVKRALGATRGRILRELLAESAWIGVLGGSIGLALGALTVELVNARTRESGTVVFDLSTRLAVATLAGSILLGLLAGLYPAMRAARLDPVAALRSE